MVTGYGRQMVARETGGDTVSEITAHAVGARHLFPDCRTVVDVGGQDSKAISLGPEGVVVKFEMNDRCAAGTGRFLEVMATTLETPLEALGPLALGAAHAVAVNSLCTVFAESEVVSLIARGEDPAAIALGLHEAIATRLAGLARRVGPRPRVVFTGGGALNPCLLRLLEANLGLELSVPEHPQLVGALGAALLAERG
jgi:(R)-2-hydroxyacyl-CoA dehydratese activating ATPase